MIDYNNKKILYFDGVCNLCQNSVQFVLKRNTKNDIYFASLQSEAGQAMLQHFNLPLNQFNSFIYIENEKFYNRSTAFLTLTKSLKNAWPLLYSFIIVPKFIRDGVYNIIAKNRYRWFGKTEQCWLPKPQWKERFLG